MFLKNLRLLVFILYGAAALYAPLKAQAAGKGKDAVPHSVSSNEPQDPVRKSFDLRNFQLEGGATLRSAKLVYTTRGTLNADRSNAILVGSPYGDDDAGSEFLIGQGMALDPEIHFIVCTNQLGNGVSSSPSNTPAPQSGPDFPAIAIRDDVEATFRLVTKELGIAHLKAVVGFSMGGQQALQWAVSHPDAMDGVVAICSTAKEYPFGLVRLEGAKGAIMGDAAWAGGRYQQPPTGGLQALGLHWVAWAYSPEWWRRAEYKTAYGRTMEEQVDNWKSTFLGNDANDLLLQANKWQRNDVGQTKGYGGNTEDALRSIKAKVLLMPSETDQYFLAADVKNDSRFIPDVDVAQIPSVWGHTAGGGVDPLANRFINRKIKEFFDSMGK